MRLAFKDTVDGGMVHYLGPYENPRVVIIVGRDNFKKDDALIESLIADLYTKRHTIMWYEHIGTSTARLIHADESVHFMHKLSILLRNPRRWIYFLPGYIQHTESISFRTKRLRQFIRSLGPERTVCIIGRSSGGRVASLFDDEQTVTKLVCLGYPFKHPEKPEELERTSHLKHMQTPFLILQGTKDTYGGREVKDRYSLAANTTLSFIDTDHDYNLSASEKERMVGMIQSFID